MTTTRSGYVLAKARKTAPEHRRYSVEEWDGEKVVYFHPQVNDWCDLPPEWAADIVWDAERPSNSLA